MNIRRGLAVVVWLLSVMGCSSVQQDQADKRWQDADFTIELNQYLQSDYNQVEAQFTTEQPLQLVFRVVSDLELTTQWFDYLDDIETLEMYSNNQFLIRSVINSPWPLTNREIITCVDTHFSPKTIQIQVTACPKRYPINGQYVRVTEAKSTWTLQQLDSGRVLVNYQAWLDPNGNIPTLFYNSQLIDSTTSSLHQLITLIETSSLDQYAY